MTRRLRAAVVIARRQGFETLLSPGLYINACRGGSCSGSSSSRGSLSRSTPPDSTRGRRRCTVLVARVLAGSFGQAFVEKLFAEGPFSLALVVAFLPVFLYLAISSVFRFGQEKSAGAVRAPLLRTGRCHGVRPSRPSSRDVVLTAAVLLVVSLFLWVAAAAGNLVLGPLFLVCLPLLFLFAVAAFAWGAFCSVVSSNASAALAAFLGILLVFLAVLAASFAMTEGSARTVTTVIAAVVQWVSPLYYASLSLRALQGGNVPGLLGGMALQLCLSAALLVAGHLVISRRGGAGMKRAAPVAGMNRAAPAAGMKRVIPVLLLLAAALPSWGRGPCPHRGAHLVDARLQRSRLTRRHSPRSSPTHSTSSRGWTISSASERPSCTGGR